MHIGRPHLLQRSDVWTVGWTVQYSTSEGVVVGVVSAIGIVRE
jgi:hypothetical protein